MNKTFITGVDENHEWMLKWWYRNITKHNPDVHITICDFGMSQKVRTWAYQNADHFIEYTKHPKNAWYLKTQVLLDSKYEYTCWIDVDCEVLTNIQDVFNYAQPGKIGLTEDWGRKFHQPQRIWWATGFNLIKGYSDLLNDWHSICKQAKVRGDQEALHELVMNNPVRSKEVIELPQEYQWLRISLQLAKQGRKGYDSPNKKVIHWTGPLGKEHIKKELMNEDDNNFNA